MAGYKYFTVLTDVGKQKLAEAIANETALDFTEMAVGDSNGTSYEPTSDMTALKHVTYRAAIGSMKINAEDKNIMEFEFVVPASTGGFYIREAGLYSSDGTLIAISRLPEQYKADMAEGAGSSMTVRILVAVSSDAQIYITVPASITYATQTYVAEEFKKHKADSNPHEQYVLNETYSDKIDELQENINSKAANTHNHDSTYLKKTDASSIYLNKTDAGNTYATKEALNTGLAGKAATNHSHSNYAANNHNHDSVYSKTNHTHTGYAASSHSHAFSAITGTMAITDTRLTGNLPVARVTGAAGKPTVTVADGVTWIETPLNNGKSLLYGIAKKTPTGDGITGLFWKMIPPKSIDDSTVKFTANYLSISTNEGVYAELDVNTYGPLNSGSYKNITVNEKNKENDLIPPTKNFLLTMQAITK